MAQHRGGALGQAVVCGLLDAVRGHLGGDECPDQAAMTPDEQLKRQGSRLELARRASGVDVGELGRLLELVELRLGERSEVCWHGR